MNKFVVLCALFAVAAAKPGVFAPLAYSAYSPYASTYAVPAAPVVPYSASIYGAPLVHSAPLAYSAPAHFIKKRSVALPLAASHYITPTTYAASPYLTTYSSPLVHSAAPLYSTPLGYSTHYLKKRSAPLALSTYYAPTGYSSTSRFDIHTTSPIVTSYAAAPIAYSSPVAYSHYYG